jgi:hypothetical protein
MFDIKGEIEKLECCASECALISDLATDRRARKEKGSLLLPTGSSSERRKWRIGCRRALGVPTNVSISFFSPPSLLAASSLQLSVLRTLSWPPSSSGSPASLQRESFLC